MEAYDDGKKHWRPLPVAVPLMTCMLVFSCDASPQAPGRHAFRFAHAESRSALEKELRDRGVAFTELEDETLIFDEPYDPRISAAIDTVIENYYSGRSVTVQDRKVFDELQDLFASRKIDVSTIQLDDQLRILWTEADDSLVRG